MSSIFTETESTILSCPSSAEGRIWKPGVTWVRRMILEVTFFMSSSASAAGP
eukprot:CAMPEP_0202012324 /NCGR_PEP_ID=MMETSP0905-20130828/23039_1 /ASSEMBLY_ACC=CAM_ASM_000554 /TAXON_ID=420261 /ORGANISM="Thalassiosira antarctica, Strain CCMP982" /LENGTH=51 /DNA_ID=CAMNT_0048571537 /DNA_START=41 /DNA_END=193 /DNA_ORIENTATION=+